MKPKTMMMILLSCLFLPALGQTTGLLIPTDGSLGPLGIEYHRAQINIKDRAAVTRVDQVFVNHTDRDLEATYIFPLPKGATVSDFYLYMNGKKTKGEILEKNRARNIYEGIVRRMQDPGLLEYLGRDLFQARVYPVPRKGKARIEIEFTNLLPFENGVVKYSYPMRTDRASAKTMQDFTMTVNIESKTPIKTIYSPSHEIYHRKKDDRHATAGFETYQALLDRDFDLFFTVSEDDIGMNLLTHRVASEPGFFLMMISPKSEYTQKEIMGKRISFVIDTSGSMDGAKMENAKEALRYCLNRLNPDDHFNLIRFSTDVELFAKDPISASKSNVLQALGFVDRVQAAGGTAIDEALTEALKGHRSQNEPNLIVFLTDGHPTVGETEPSQIIKKVKVANQVSSRIFVFGVGDDINTQLLDQISSQNFGDSTYVRTEGEIKSLLAGFYDKVSHPVLTDLGLDFGSIHAYDILPKRLPDLFKGSQLLVLGRYRNDGHAAVRLKGVAGKEKRTFTFEGKFQKNASDNDFIPRLWATRKIGFLLDNIRLHGENRELVDEVIGLSKRYGIVTPYTSYLVTEDQAVATPSSTQPIVRPRKTRDNFDRPRAGSGRSESSPVAPSQTQAPGEGLRGLAPEPMAQQKKAAIRFQTYANEKEKVMKEESGARAVHFAEAVKDLKSAQADRSEDDEVAGIRYLAGQAFRYQDGGWVDTRYQANMKTLKIKYLGKAYFALIQKSEKLKTIFTLGRKITIVVAPDRALVIDADGQDQVPEAELNKFKL